LQSERKIIITEAMDGDGGFSRSQQMERLHHPFDGVAAPATVGLCLVIPLITAISAWFTLSGDDKHEIKLRCWLLVS
jgi:hypothetical protein